MALYEVFAALAVALGIGSLTTHTDYITTFMARVASYSEGGRGDELFRTCGCVFCLGA
jgi:hypothetical protein